MALLVNGIGDFLRTWFALGLDYLKQIWVYLEWVGLRAELTFIKLQSLERYHSSFPLFLLFTKLIVGNGQNIRFWTDSWSRCLPSKDRFTRLLNRSSKKHSPISLLVSSTLDWNLHLEEILERWRVRGTNFLIGALKTSLRPDIPYRRIWSLGSDGIFSGSSFF